VLTEEKLRDIFSVNWMTPCNTHDLIDCPCSEDGTVPDLRAASSSSQHTEEGCHEDEREGGFVNASQVKPKDIIRADLEVYQY
jgi:DNA repair and recombination protein RAD54B